MNIYLFKTILWIKNFLIVFLFASGTGSTYDLEIEKLGIGRFFVKNANLKGPTQEIFGVSFLQCCGAGAGAGAGAGILKLQLRLRAPAPGQTKVVYLIIIHIE